MTFGFGLRLLLVSISNYLFGNLLFAALWNFFHNHLAYWEIAFVSTCIASVFSYQTQSRLILRLKMGSIVNFQYVAFQITGLLLSILVVPAISDHFRINIIIVQFGWSALFSLVSLFLLQKNKFSSSSIFGFTKSDGV
jgi:hypothetical protein